MATLISQLKTIITKAEALERTVTNFMPKPDDWQEITNLSLRLNEVTFRIRQNVEDSKRLRKERYLKEAREVREQGKQYRENQTRKDLKKAPVFRRNIILIFGGPKESPFDGTTEKHRKEITRQRCAVLRSLNIDGILFWAMSYTPTSWSGGKMSWDLFYNLASDIEPNERQKWSPDLLETLIAIRDEGLSGNAEYELFLTGNYSRVYAIIDI
ncbi:hypothetical protein BDV38DRAFT_43030 [Aspergillus pseudotamarii]|uniref:Uncharacterized protein n=1 Tax=Aspergillus pseudotamarii TaxID=132259 RepID=A0A5N6SAD4_ASPPS|nr:uncharacterized protein BDV38DRAFT_43030 [Aspergillus pseudotamarii]KAE8130819.1 hypothetical protein BDV38DRAFT_43030 [Aspergillus pseudotamarii]